MGSSPTILRTHQPTLLRAPEELSLTLWVSPVRNLLIQLEHDSHLMGSEVSPYGGTVSLYGVPHIKLWVSTKAATRYAQNSMT